MRLQPHSAGKTRAAPDSPPRAAEAAPTRMPAIWLVRARTFDAKPSQSFVGALTFDNDSFLSNQDAPTFDKTLSTKLVGAPTSDIDSFFHHVDAPTFDPKLS